GLVLARRPLQDPVGIVVLGAILFPLEQHFLRPYQAHRLQAFLSGGHDPAANWSLLQSHIAIGSGGLFGTRSVPMHELLAQYLPARQTDLAFASLIEQWGLLAGVLALMAVVTIVWRLVITATESRSFNGAVMAVAFALVSLGALTYQIQQVQGAMLTQFGSDQMTRCQRLDAPRGQITDRHGTPLALNAATDRVMVVPALYAQSGGSLGQLA